MTAVEEGVVVAQRPDAAIENEPTTKADRPRSLRRFLRFNLLTLLVGLLLLAIYFGVRQRFAVSLAENQAKRELSDLHASYKLAPAYPRWAQYALLQFGEDAQHVEAVTFPPYYPHVDEVQEAHRLTSQELSILAKLPRLRSVDFTNAIFDEAGLAALQHCGELKELVLSATLVGDKGIERLAGQPTLSVVRLDRTLTSDAALKTLAELPKLTEVSLDDATTAEGIASLAKSPTFRGVNAVYTQLSMRDLDSLKARGGSFTIPGRRTWSLSPAPEEEAYWQSVRGGNSYWADAAERHLTDERYLSNLVASPNVCVVNVHAESVVDPEKLSALLAEPQILEIYLDTPGPPVSYKEIQKVQNRSRPKDAPPCIVYGNVSITGEQLVYECERVRNAKRRSTGPIYAPYVIVDLQPEHIERLNRAAASSEVRVQPHTDDPVEFVSQSSLLAELSPVFVQIPMP